MTDAEAASAPPHHTLLETHVIELTYRRGGAVSLPDGRPASSEFTAARMLLAAGAMTRPPRSAPAGPAARTSPCPAPSADGRS